MPTTIRFRRDGVAMHMHPVAGSAQPQGRWHQPWERHPSDPQAHSREDAEHPYVSAGRYPVSWERREFYLTSDQEATYFRALQGGRPANYFRPRNGATLIMGHGGQPLDIVVQNEEISHGEVAEAFDIGETISAAFLFASDTRRFGVEIECITNTTAFIEAAARKGITVRTRGYSHETPGPNVWMLTPDGSLSYSGGRAGHRTIEVVSPILQGDAGIRALKNVCDALNEAGTLINRTCGLHVHHDAANLDVSDVKRLANSWSNVQGFIDTLVAPSRRGGNTYCSRFTASDLATINSARSIREMASGVGRYKNVNIGHAYAAHQTIEVRQHGGSFDFKKIVAWVKLGQAIIKYSERETLAPQVSLEGMLTTLGMHDDLKAFLKNRQHILANGGL